VGETQSSAKEKGRQTLNHLSLVLHKTPFVGQARDPFFPIAASLFKEAEHSQSQMKTAQFFGSHFCPLTNLYKVLSAMTL
jgi:hypothetical protein